MANLNILAMVGAVATAVVVAAAVEASGRFNRCHASARSAGWNGNDEADRWGYDGYMSQCQYGTNEQTAREFETWKARREPVRLAASQPARPAKKAEQRKPKDDWERWTLNPAQPQYLKYGVNLYDRCRELSVYRGWNFDECMSGRRSR